MAGATEAEFVANVQLQDAVIRRIEIVGEAARRLSPETRAALGDLPWALLRPSESFVTCPTETL